MNLIIPILGGLLTVAIFAFFICLKFTVHSVDPESRRSALETAQNILMAVNEDGRAIWSPDGETIRVTYVVSGSKHTSYRIWVRLTVTRIRKTAVVETAHFPNVDEMHYAETIRKAFVELGVTATLEYNREEPHHDEMFVYPAPDTESKSPA